VPEFVYLFRSSEPRAVAELQAHIDQWLAWVKELDEKGHLKTVGSPLGPEGRVIRGEERTVTDGPDGMGNDVVDGYMVIEAADLADAAEVAKGCPLLAEGVLIEVRPVMKLEF
jgi:hypothetical protein